MPDEHFIVDPVLISLLEYMLNRTYCPGEVLLKFDKPVFHQANRNHAPHTPPPPPFQGRSARARYHGQLQHIKNYPKSAAHRATRSIRSTPAGVIGAMS
jgi:hypothetical protein